MDEDMRKDDLGEEDVVSEEVDSDEVQEEDDGQKDVAVDNDQRSDDDDEKAEDSSDASDGDSDADESQEEKELDHVADIAIGVLDDVLKYFSLGETTIDEYEGDDGELILDITGDDLAVLIGRHGRTLDALQLLVATATSRRLGHRFPVVVDVEGYKDRQRTKLEKMAYRAAEKALDQDREVRMRPMNPYERRLVHLALRDYDGVYTQSEGSGADRHVVVHVEDDEDED